MAEKEIETFCPTSRQHWREWLEAHHAEKQCIWLVYYKKNSGKPSLSWSEAVEEALCFGWIDSRAQPIDDEKYQQFFSRRKPNSVWSKINKKKIEQLIDNGKMTEAGFKSIEVARQNGSWTILDGPEAGVIPPDLEEALQKRPNANTFFLSLSRSNKRNILQWLVLAKRPATRQSRIADIVEQADQGQKPRAMQWTKKEPTAKPD